MAITVLIGVGLILLSIVGSTVMDGNSFGPLIGPSSFILVLGCAVGAAAISAEMAELKLVPKAIVKALKSSPPDLTGRINLYMDLAELVRRDGLLGLESRMESVDDAFVKHGLQMVIDGTDEEDLRKELTAWVRSVEERHAVAPAILRKLAVYSPAFGMVGTIIGLVNMLGNLADPDQLGGGMALALLTTLYGSLFANLFFQPLAERLERQHETEMSAMAFDADAIFALQSGTSPRSLVAYLESLLPPSERQGYTTRSQTVKGPDKAAA